jgi:hypothetical protein
MRRTKNFKEPQDGPKFLEIQDIKKLETTFQIFFLSLFNNT